MRVRVGRRSAMRSKHWRRRLCDRLDGMVRWRTIRRGCCCCVERKRSRISGSCSCSGRSIGRRAIRIVIPRFIGMVVLLLLVVMMMMVVIGGGGGRIARRRLLMMMIVGDRRGRRRLMLSATRTVSLLLVVIVIVLSVPILIRCRRSCCCGCRVGRRSRILIVLGIVLHERRRMAVKHVRSMTVWRRRRPMILMRMRMRA
mmetsp:Transcript_45077/g.74706  ORF Transcript_45077/g.74706 Transcript_45077/m.74706 type:complete len:200 (-) Transcript_45077:28-627(-)